MKARLEEDVRLLTLVGPPGVGKTRLALQAASELRDADAFPDGIFWVGLASVHSPDLVGPTIAQAIGLRQDGSRPLMQTLTTFVRERNVLLLVDSFEHVTEAASLVGELLEAGPGLHVLVTSRTRLSLYGEVQLAVEPLTVPDLDDLPPTETLLRIPAVRLFVRRAEAAGAAVARTRAEAVAVAQICVRLDGLPLAIELAAARVKLLPPQILLPRLEHRLAVLTDGPVDLPARQRSLRASLAWSYELLSPTEQVLFRRLAVFVGGWTLEAAAAVCRSAGDPTGPLARRDLLDDLGPLVDGSLVRSDEQANGTVRFSMLETIREYAREQLAASGEEEVLGAEHATYYLAVAEEAEPRLLGPEQATWLLRLDADLANLRAALAWARAADDVTLGLRLAGAVWRFWAVRGYLREGRAWLEGFLAEARRADADVPPSALVTALRGAASLAHYQGDLAGALAHGEESLALCQELGDVRGSAFALNNLGVLSKDQGDYARATALFEESLALRRGLGQPGEIAQSLSNLGMVATDQGDDARATGLYEQSLSLQRQVGDQRSVALTLYNLGVIAYRAGEWERTAALETESLALYQLLGDKAGMAYALIALGDVARAQDDHGHAVGRYLESIALLQIVGDTVTTAECLEGLAADALAQHEGARAVSLYSVAAALREASGAPVSPRYRTRYDEEVAAARQVLGDAGFAVAWAAGQAMTVDQALAAARALEQ